MTAIMHVRHGKVIGHRSSSLTCTSRENRTADKNGERPNDGGNRRRHRRKASLTEAVHIDTRTSRHRPPLHLTHQFDRLQHHTMSRLQTVVFISRRLFVRPGGQCCREASSFFSFASLWRYVKSPEDKPVEAKQRQKLLQRLAFD